MFWLHHLMWYGCVIFQGQLALLRILSARQANHPDERKFLNRKYKDFFTWGNISWIGKVLEELPKSLPRNKPKSISLLHRGHSWWPQWTKWELGLTIGSQTVKHLLLFIHERKTVKKIGDTEVYSSWEEEENNLKQHKIFVITESH